MKSVLIVKLAALGDIAVASATARAIRERYPRARVTWLTGTRGAELVTLFREVDEIITVDDAALLRGSWIRRIVALLGAWRRLAGRRFDRVLVLHADRRYRWLTLPVRTSRVDAFTHGTIPLLTHDRAAEYVRIFSEDSPGPSVELSAIDHRIRKAPGAATQRTVVLVPGGARNVLRDDEVRRWPLDNYRQLAERLVHEGFRVALMGDANDVYVRSHFADIEVVDHVGRQTLHQALQTLTDADLLVTHDTGPLHFARLARTPAVAIFGPTDPRHVVGGATGIVSLWGGATLACRPCYDGRDFPPCPFDVACMRDVTVDRVVEAVITRLQERAPGPSASRPMRRLASENLEDAGDPI